MFKLTLVTINGRSAFINLPVVQGQMVEVEENVLRPDVKVRSSFDEVAKATGFTYRRGDCIRLGL